MPNTPNQLMLPIIALGRLCQTVRAISCYPWADETPRATMPPEIGVPWMHRNQCLSECFDGIPRRTSKPFHGAKITSHEAIEWYAKVLKQALWTHPCVKGAQACSIRQQGFSRVECNIGPQKRHCTHPAASRSA